MPPKTKTLSPQEELSAYVQKLASALGGFEHVYEKRFGNEVYLVLENENYSILVDICRLFPNVIGSLPYTKYISPTLYTFLCNNACEIELEQFVKTGKITPSIHCGSSTRQRYRDGFLEPLCYWRRVYNEVHRAPQEIARIQRYAARDIVRLPVLEFPVGPETYIPTSNGSYIHALD